MYNIYWVFKVVLFLNVKCILRVVLVGMEIFWYRYIYFYFCSSSFFDCVLEIVIVILKVYVKFVYGILIFSMYFVSIVRICFIEYSIILCRRYRILREYWKWFLFIGWELRWDFCIDGS